MDRYAYARVARRLIAAGGLALGLMALSASAQTTAPPSRPPPSRPGSGVGVGVRIDPTQLLTLAPGRGGSPDWKRLPRMGDPLGLGPPAVYDGVTLYTPGPDGGPGIGVRVDLVDPRRGLRRVTVNGVVIGPDGRPRTINTVSDERSSGRPCPCETNAEIAQLRAEVERLRAELDKAAAPPPAQPPAPPPAPPPPVPAPPQQPAMPGQGASAVSIPIDVTNADGREIDHANWDVIRLVFSGNRIQLVNGSEDWLRQNPEVPADGAQWVRDNLGVIPQGDFDFGALDLGGQTLQQIVEDPCQPPPTLEELKRFKTVDRVVSINHQSGRQTVSTKQTGRDDQSKQTTVKASSFNLDLSITCHWSWNSQTGEVRRRASVNLAVQYQGRDGKIHGVTYASRDPQPSWIYRS